MRHQVEFASIADEPCPNWRQRLLDALLRQQLHPVVLRDCGVTPELLAFCGIHIDELLRPRQSRAKPYCLEQLIDAFDLNLDDLQLLGFIPSLLYYPATYPLIVLWKLCNFDAAALFSYNLSYKNLCDCVLDVDERYGKLLDLNLPFWKRVL